MDKILKFLKNYPKKIKIMEVCGTHTSVIHKNGLRSLLSENIQLVSGPGCPVCVTKMSYIDRLVELSKTRTILTFGDMVKVKGVNGSLLDVKNKHILYNPVTAIEIALENPKNCYYFAAVGFETTLPIYGLMLERCPKNLTLVTSLKAVVPAMEYICKNEEGIDCFLAPGHVAAIIGSKSFENMSEKYKKPIVITGFTPEYILLSVYTCIKMYENEEFKVRNLYKNVVKEEGNLQALSLISKHFTLSDDYWRGIGIIENSAYICQKNEVIVEIEVQTEKCHCTDIILGRINPPNCPLFGKKCTPLNAIGPCMVSSEGACRIWY